MREVINYNPHKSKGFIDFSLVTSPIFIKNVKTDKVVGMFSHDQDTQKWSVTLGTCVIKEYFNTLQECMVAVSREELIFVTDQ